MTQNPNTEAFDPEYAHAILTAVGDIADFRTEGGVELDGLTENIGLNVGQIRVLAEKEGADALLRDMHTTIQGKIAEITECLLPWNRIRHSREQIIHRTGELIAYRDVEQWFTELHT